ncbi:hypothetical protein FE634_12615 [Nocardioides dongxiaopingii]|nr:hypothetical protein FE634_12615 [Nocardioides sp. S-1144]
MLERADDLLRGPSPHRARFACWIARSSFELLVAGLLVQRDLDPGSASMRTRLSCLQVAYLDRPEVAARADYIWARLSQACHQHAYELGPTVHEARGLVARVVDLAGVIRVSVEVDA